MWFLRYAGWLFTCCYAVARVPGVVATHFFFICGYSFYIYIFYKITLIENQDLFCDFNLIIKKMLVSFTKKYINKQQAALN